MSGTVDNILDAFNKTGRELFNKVANKVDDVVTNIKNGAQDLADRLIGKINEVTRKIDDKAQDALRSVASKADDAINDAKEWIDRLEYNIRKFTGKQEECAGIGDIYIPPEKSKVGPIEDKLNKIIENREGSIKVNPGKTNTRSENSLRNKLKNRMDADGNRIYSDEEIEDIITMRNSECELTLENGNNITLKRHGYQKLEEGQSHHLNQDATFKGVIPTNEVITIKLEGNAFTDFNSSHQNVHKSLEEFWDLYRDGGTLNGVKPTIGEYNVGLKDSMKSAGFSEDDADLIVEIARHQQEVYGLSESSEVPGIHGKIYFKDNGGN